MTHRWAVVIGIDRFLDAHHYGALRSCVADATAVHTALLDGGYDPDRVRLITHDAAVPPLRSAIRTALIDVVNAAEPEDSVLVYFSGHGDFDETTKSSYLLPHDGYRADLPGTALAITELREVLAPVKRRLLILDACRSGAAVDKSPSAPSPQFVRRVFEQAAGVAVLASCQQGERSYEHEDRLQSVFTGYLLEGLRKADDGKGFVTAQDLNRYVTDKVTWWAKLHNVAQTPTFEAAMSGDLVVVDHRAAGPAAEVRPENPFWDRGTIRDPDRFFGRAEELRQAAEELGKGLSLQVVAPYQQGKSSFLMRLRDDASARLNWRREDFGYLNLEMVYSNEEFWAAMCDVLSLDGPRRGMALKRELKRRTAPGRPKVLLLDNIERMVGGTFTLALRSELRGQADDDDARLRLVVATKRPLKDVFTDAPAELSPLAGICQPVYLEPFRDAEARAFVEQRLTPTGVTFSPEVLRAVVTEAKGDPAQLQRLASAQFDRIRGVR